MEDDFGRGNVAFGAQNGQRVRVRSPIGTPHDRGVGDVLAKEGSQVGAVVFQLGLHPGLSAVSASLQSVRGADGHVERCVGVAQGRSEARYLHLRGVVALLCGRVDERGDGIVTARGLAQGAAGGMRGARVQDARVAGGAGDWFCGSSTAQTEADRVDVLVRIQGQGLSRHMP